MRVAVTGASGLIGRRLVGELLAAGHEVTVLQRRPGPAPANVAAAPWPQVEGSQGVQAALPGLQAVVHLAGSPIAAERWSSERKAEIVESRGAATLRLVAGLHAAGARPAAFLCASAVGYYGPSGDEEIDETQPAGQDFLARVCASWEEAAQGAASLGARVVRLRTGVVLDPGGGMLARLLPFFRLGLGGPVGSGRQWLPWISLEDEVRAILFLLGQGGAEGPFNLCAPDPVQSGAFAQVLGQALHRPARLRLPAALVRLAFGEMGDAVLLSGQRAVPRRLEELGFGFSHRDVASALQALLP